MPPHAAAAVLRPVLGGLATAHHAGLVHRDVKPENVLISDDGEVKLVDFGLVRAVAEAGITSTSVILGTAAYLSPEQVSSGAADARSDVYAVGILAYELITGTTPFTGDNPLTVAYQRMDNDVPLAQHGDQRGAAAIRRVHRTCHRPQCRRAVRRRRGDGRGSRRDQPGAGAAEIPCAGAEELRPARRGHGYSQPAHRRLSGRPAGAPLAAHRRRPSRIPPGSSSATRRTGSPLRPRTKAQKRQANSPVSISASSSGSVSAPGGRWCSGC